MKQRGLAAAVGRHDADALANAEGEHGQRRGEQAQSAADAEYFLAIAGRRFTGEEEAGVRALLLRAYRWQYIASGVQDARYLEILGSLIDAAQGARINAALRRKRRSEANDRWLKLGAIAIDSVGRRVTLAPLGPWGRHFTVFFNATKLALDGDQDADFAGFIPKNMNWGVTFTRKPVTLIAKWNYRGEQKGAAFA